MSLQNKSSILLGFRSNIIIKYIEPFLMKKTDNLRITKFKGFIKLSKYFLYLNELYPPRTPFFDRTICQSWFLLLARHAPALESKKYFHIL